MSRKPNILVICSDQHHPLMSGYRGHPFVKTPNLDALAMDGVAFTQAYCNSPVCTPSRMSFITGKYAHQIGSWFLEVPLDPKEMTWPRRLDQAGIPSTMIGKMDFCGRYQSGGFSDWRIIERREAWADYPRTSPFDARLDGYIRRDKWQHILNAGVRADCRTDGQHGHDDRLGFYDHDRHVTDWTLEYLEQKAHDDEPWALYVGLLFPHWPYCVPQKYFDMYYPDQMELPFDFRYPNPDLHPELQHFQRCMAFGEITEDDLRRVVAAYCGMISCMDDMIGEIIQSLKRRGLYENTHIIYTTDHGESLGEHGLFYKQCAYEGSVGVPLIVRGPGLQRGAVNDRPVQLVDMYPTVLDMAGLDAEPGLPGSSWLPLCRGQAQPERAAYAFSEHHGNFLKQDWYMIRQGDYKYVHYDKQRPSLFNLRQDPRELRDLALESAYAQVLAEYEAILRTVCDPDAVSLQAKRELGLIGEHGEDYTLTLSVRELAEGREMGRFPAESRAEIATPENEY